MKRMRLLWIFVALVAAIAVNQYVLWPMTGIRFIVNSECVKVTRWTKGGYDSWGISYSYGRQIQADGTWKNLWHPPRWHRAKWRNQ